MLFLTATTETFTFVTAAALSTDWSAGYVDLDTTIGATAGSAQGNVATATTTTVVAAPGASVQRQLKSFTAVNKDAASTQTVTLNKVTAAGTFALCRTIALAPNETLVYIDSIGFTVLDSTGRVKTNASVVTALATPRAINGVNFDGTAAITVTAAAGTLTGATLAAGVTASSLTSVGTLTSLTLAGAVAGVTDLTTTGNTILGDAAGDTLNVGNGGLIKDANGNVGIGGVAFNSTSLLTVHGHQVIQAAVTGGVSLYTYDSTGTLATQIAYDGTSSGDEGMTVMTRKAIPLRFGINAVEKARIDTSGNLLVGTTSTTPNPGWAFAADGSGSVGNSAQASGWTFQHYRRSGTAIGSVTQSGTTAVLYNTTSDARLKTDIVDAPEASALIDAIRVRSFRWKSVDEHVTHGLIAQELVAIAPLAVKVGDDGDEVTESWGVDPAKLVPLLVREVQSLRARVHTLEAIH